MILTAKYEILHCCSCSIPFALTESHVGSLRKSHEGFYCPNGHNNYYPAKSKVETLQNEIAQLATAKIQLENQLNTANRALENSKQGKCPCCGKVFKKLAAHIRAKHS